MKILVSPSSFGECGSEPLNILEKNNYEIIENPYGRKLTETEVIEIGRDCVGIVAGVEPLNKNVLENLPLLKCISRVGVGMDNVDLEYAKSKGIIVRNTPDGPTRPVAELTIGLTFALLKKISIADKNLKNHVWKKEIGNLIFKKKVGIFGLGRIGKMVAGMFNAFGTELIGYDLFPDHGWAEKNNLTIVDKETLFKFSDIITLHVPGNSDKSHVIGKHELDLMNPNSFLINISRGGVVDETMLYEYLKEGKIAGAAIDVFKNEPYSGNLTELNNVVLTPHLGSYAAEAKLQMEVDAVNNLIESLQ